MTVEKKIKFVLFIVCYSLFTKLFASEIVPHTSTIVDVNENVSLQCYTGIINGTANEYVYLNNYKISQLVWDMKNVNMIGCGLTLKLSQTFVIHLNSWGAINRGNGTMDDYDWLYVGLPWSHWSHSDSFVSKGSIFDANFEFKSKPLLEHISFSGFIGYKQENWKWAATGGSYIYSDTDNKKFRDETGTFPNQTVVTYEQTFKAPYFGAGFLKKVRDFEFRGKAIASPCISVNTTDNHLLRNMVVTTSLQNGTMIEIDLSGSYNFSEAASIQLFYSITKYDTVKGNSKYQYDDGSISIFEDAAGADLQTQLIALSLIFKF